MVVDPERSTEESDAYEKAFDEGVQYSIDSGTPDPKIADAIQAGTNPPF